MNLRCLGLRTALIFAASLFCFCTQLNAHFVWIYSEGDQVKVVFGEDLEPDQAQFLSGLGGMKVFTFHGREFKKVDFAKQVDGGEGWFEAKKAKLGSVVEASCPYGVFGRGDKTMFLDYSAKYVSLQHSKVGANKPSGNLALDVIPTFVDGEVSLVAYFNGKPLKGVEVQLEYVETDSLTTTTNEQGVVGLKPNSRYVIRAKHVVEEAGEVDGKKFAERRYYCTLVVDVGDREATAGEKAEGAESTGTKRADANLKLRKVDSEFADFPRGMTSFGATVLDGHIYVMGGKSGRAHSYARSYQNRNVYCLKLDGSDNQWQVASENHGLQGLAIVGHGKHVYRIGGLEARNKEGEDHDLHSVDDFRAFDPVKKTWVELPDLPEGRSSFDACVAGDHVYVAGGWTMAGEEDSVWATDMLRFDLSKPDSKWESIKAPFETRALSMRHHQGKLVVIGGIQGSVGPTAAVHIYDLETGKWSEGPEVPIEGRMKAFGCDAVSIGGHLLVSTYDGGIFRLSNDAKSWTNIHQLETGRFFHQMLPVGKSQFALVGGSHMEHGSQMEVEVYEVVDVSQESKR